MELKEATYKTTELGLIPEDWSITTLSKVGSFSKGKGIKKDEVQTDGIPCVRYGELYTKYDNIITFFHSYISEEVAASSIQIKEGDILFAGSGETREEIGKCAAMLYADRVFAGGDIVVLRPNNFDSTFLGYLLNAPIIAKQKSIKGQGDAVVHIYSSGLANVKIPVPPPEEQKAIATALSDVDTLITNLDKLIAKKKAIKQGAMQRLLKSPAQGGQRLLGFKGEWVEGCLGDFCTVITKGTTPTSLGKQFTETGIAFVKAESIAESGTLIQEKLAYIDEETNDLLERSKLKEGDLLFSIAGVLGRIGLIRSIDLPANTNQAVAIVRLNPNKNVDRNFIFQILRTTSIKKHIEAISVQGAQSNFSLKDVNEIPITIPFDKDEQIAIASILSDMTDDIESLKRKKSKYLRIKQGMMQELLTGKTRLV